MSHSSRTINVVRPSLGDYAQVKRSPALSQAIVGRVQHTVGMAQFYNSYFGMFGAQTTKDLLCFSDLADWLSDDQTATIELLIDQ